MAKMGFFSVKMVLISTGVVSTAMLLKLSVPVITHFIVSEAPTIWTFLLTCLTPPYLYLLLNAIILTIVATSKFHNSPTDTSHHPTEPLIYNESVLPPVQSLVPEPLKISQADYNPSNAALPVAYVYEPKTTTPPSSDPRNDSGGYNVYHDVLSDPYVYEAKTTPLSNDTVTTGNGYDENVAARTTVGSDDAVVFSSLRKKDSMEFAFSNDENVKPPVSARFSHRKAVKASPEGGKVVALGVAKPKRHDTLESTWRTITEGRAMPLTRHLKKSDTWEQQPRRNAGPLTDLNNGGTPVMKKSETFGGKEKSSSASPGSGGGRLRKEPSLSQDELNRRVEAFINKFNAEMRLQRQESLRQYREMINRGNH